MHYFREAVQSTIATPTQPTTLQHPGTMGNAAAVAVKDKGDIWYVTDATVIPPQEVTSQSSSLVLI